MKWVILLSIFVVISPGIAQTTNSVPAGSGFVQMYPTQQPASIQSEVVINKSIRPLPPPSNMGYGTIVGQPNAPVTTEIIVIGGCPACRIGVLDDDYTCMGICCAIFCFPLGILCCLACKNKRCTNCGAEF